MPVRYECREISRPSAELVFRMDAVNAGDQCRHGMAYHGSAQTGYDHFHARSAWNVLFSLRIPVKSQVSGLLRIVFRTEKLIRWR